MALLEYNEDTGFMVHQNKWVNFSNYGIIIIDLLYIGSLYVQARLHPSFVLHPTIPSHRSV